MCLNLDNNLHIILIYDTIMIQFNTTTMRIQTTVTDQQIEFLKEVQQKFWLRNLWESLVFWFLNYWQSIKSNNPDIDIQKWSDSLPIMKLSDEEMKSLEEARQEIKNGKWKTMTRKEFMNNLQRR